MPAEFVALVKKTAKYIADRYRLPVIVNSFWTVVMEVVTSFSLPLKSYRCLLCEFFCAPFTIMELVHAVRFIVKPSLTFTVELQHTHSQFELELTSNFHI